MSSALTDLTPFAGLGVWLDARTGELYFGPGVTSDPAGARLLGELRDVLRDPDADGPDLAYRLYRGVRRVEDEPLLAAAGLRHDLTVTLPGTLGAEYVKTAGHYHPQDGDGVSFPELYEVVHGRAAFVLQHVDDVTAEAPRVRQIWVQLCDAGDRILIPPDCGHVTVNIGTVPLVVADLISLRSGHLYGSFKTQRGAATHVLADAAADDRLRLEQNPSYGRTPTPVLARGSRTNPTHAERGSAYAHAVDRPSDYAFLDRPTACASLLLSLWQRTRSA